ncbi:hypothetical protein Pfo_021761, partial [Paulownia fortunei]
KLPVRMCSFSIASSGKQCLSRDFRNISRVKSACGVERNSVCISSDSLLETQFTLKLCSPQCYDNCPNIVDLYYNLALAEGVLPDLCKSKRTSYCRSVIQLQSSGAAASGPISEATGPTYEAAYAPSSSITLSSVDCAPAPMLLNAFSFHKCRMIKRILIPQLHWTF